MAVLYSWGGQSSFCSCAVDTRVPSAQIVFADEMRGAMIASVIAAVKHGYFVLSFFLSVKLITFIGVKTTTKFIIKDYVMKNSFIQ